ncbi:MAG: SAM-dependent methyltransferase [Flavobacteriales bacterium]|nr:MAG: SAM-dependent methyltransferase [Flavobacteriales bacterium]
MKRNIIKTADGSHTIFLPDYNEYYHSKHGAINEACHVFIKNGLHQFTAKDPVNILEMGFGTGLNAFISFLETVKHGYNINYTAIEAFPVKPDEIVKLNYVSSLKSEKYSDIFSKLHDVPWQTKHQISDKFSLTKTESKLENVSLELSYNLIYFDAFGPRVQPELWTLPIFEKLYNCLENKGILVTYSAKGSVKRNLQEAGFNVEKLTGPPNKRHMLRATKTE